MTEQYTRYCCCSCLDDVTIAEALQGQWRADLFNGQGCMSHTSGFKYEGLWINGRPAKMATKLVCSVENPLELNQGVPFALVIECHNEDGELVPGMDVISRNHKYLYVIVDQGREIQITAGYRYTAPPKAADADASNTALFDVIEDVEEKPIPTNL